MYKNCTFSKMGKKKIDRKDKSKKSLTPAERAREIKKWRDGWLRS